MAFDVQGARAAGYSEDEIAGFLAQQSGFDLGAARKAGYQTAEILDFLNKPAAPAQPTPGQATDAEIDQLATAGAQPGSAAAQINATPEKRRSSVLEGVYMPEPEFDSAEGMRLSLRSAAETQPARRDLPGAEMRQGREIEPRGIVRAAADTALAAGQGAVGMLKGVADNVDAGDNAVSNLLDKSIQGLEVYKSDDLRDQLVKRDALISTTQRNQGELAAARAALQSIWKLPAAGADVAARGSGSLIPTIAMGAAGLGPASMWATNALSNAGDAANQTADALRRLPPSDWQNDERYLSLLQDGQTHEQAVATLAPIYALPAQALGALTGALSGRTGLERVIAGRSVGAGMRARAGAAGAELAGEQAETLIPQAAGNLAVGSVDRRTEVTEGLGRGAADTLIGSGPGAALAAAAPQRAEPAAPAAAPITAPIAAIAPAQTVDEAIAAAQQSLNEVPVESVQAVQNIERILGEANVSPSTAVPGVDTGATGSGVDLAAPGLGAGVGTDGAQVQTVDTGSQADQLPAADIPQPAGPDLDALRTDNAALRAQAIQALESQQVSAAPAGPVPAARGDEPAAQLPAAGPAALEAGGVAAEPPIVKYRKEAQQIESALPPVAVDMTRLWRGNRPDEIGRATVFTNDLPGIAIPFRNSYGGKLSYVDVPTADLPALTNKAGAATDAEFTLPAEIAAKALPATPSARQVALDAERAKLEAQRVKRSTAAREAAKPMEGLSVGTMPTNAEPVSVKDGVVYVGKYPAQNFDTGADVTVPPDATPGQVVDALKASGALGKRSKFFGLPANESPAQTTQKPEPTLASPEQQRADFAAAEKARTAPGNRARARAHDANPFKDFIAKHGISAALAAEFAPGRKERQAALVQGYGPIFRRSGLQLDALAELAVQDGYLTTPDVAKLSAMIADALRGKRVIPQYAEGAAEMEMEARAALEKEAGEEQNAEVEAETQAERDAIQALADLSDDNPLLTDDVNIGAGSNTSLADFLRAMGATEEEIANETAGQDQGQGRARQDGEGPGRAQENAAPQAPATAGRREDTARDDGEGLTAPTRADIEAQQDRTETAPARDQREQVRRESEAGAGLFSLTMQDGRQDTTGSLFDQPAERFEVGKSLTKEQRKQVLSTLIDVYKAKGAPREQKGVGRDGNERSGYAYSPELFEKSDVTGAMVRYYVTLPDGRIAHPSELFPDLSTADVESMAAEQVQEQEKAAAYENAIKPFYSDYADAELRAGKDQTVISKGDRFAVIPDSWGAVKQAESNGWKVAQRPAAPTSAEVDAKADQIMRLFDDMGGGIALTRDQVRALIVEKGMDAADKSVQAFRQKIQQDKATQEKLAKMKPAAEKSVSQMSAADLLRAAADKMEKSQEQPASQAPKAAARSRAAAPAEITDFGEKLPPARRAMAAKLDESLSDEKIATLPFSQVWPAAENDAIEDTFAAAVAHTARAEVPAKPRVAYKLKRWVEQVKTVRDLASMIVSGKVTREDFIKRSGEYALKNFIAKVKLLEQLDRADWKRIDKVSEAPDAFQYGKDGTRVAKPMVSVTIDGRHQWIEGSGDILQHVEAIKAMLGKDAPESRMQFEIRQESRGDRKVFINKKGDKEYRRLMEFATVEEARAAMKDKYADLVAAWESVKDRDNISERDLRTAENRPRTGKDHRGGKDVTAEEFQQQFGFRGGEFGKWVSQGSGAQERQFMLNSAYDALMDLSDLLGIPPKAISLEGSLGMAFGSRGGGWASAHFEPSNLVINLTKPRGAGALAHEWFHALDNYFARKRGGEVPFTGNQDQYRRDNYVTYKTKPMMVRKDGRGTPVTKERLEEWRKGNPGQGYLAADQWIEDPNHKPGVRAEVEQRFEDLVQALNASPMLKRSRVLDGKKEAEGYWSQVIERAARSFENYVQTRMMEQGYHNDFLANVKAAIDVGKNKDRYPYLLPDEVAPIAEAFDNLFQTIETKETDSGVAMFSQAEAGSTPSFTAEEFRREIGLLRVRDRHGISVVTAWTAEELPDAVKQAAAVAGAPLGGVRGVIMGRPAVIYIVGSNHSTLQEVQETVFHELYGHYGTRKLFGKAMYAKLSDLYARIGAQRFLELAKKYGLDVQSYGNTARRQANDNPGLTERAGGTMAMRQGILMEELLAHIAQRETGTIRQKAREIIGMLRQWLRDNGFAKLAEYGDTDLAYLLKKGREAIVQESDGAPAFMMAEGAAMARGMSTEAFMRAFAPPAAMTVDRASEIVNEITATWDNGPTFKVVSTPADLPIAAPADARGLIHNGTAYVVAANNPTRDAVARTLGHEAIGHYGLWKMLGEDGTRQFQRNLQLAVKTGNKPLNAIRDKVRRLYVDDKGKFNLTPEQEADEIAAFAVEEAIDPATGEFRPGFGFMKSVWAKIADFLRALGIKVRFTNAELQGLLVQSMQGLQAGQRLDGAEDLLIAAARQQQDQTQTPAFRKWFGDSKVVDDQGKPLAVYHGTQASFDRFDEEMQGSTVYSEDIGFFFTNDTAEASSYATLDFDKENPKPNVMPVFLSIQNPKIVTLENEQSPYDNPAIWYDNEGREAAQEAIDAGNDGLIVIDNRDDMQLRNGAKPTLYIAFRPEQIKSAIGNSGNFDPANPDIRYARGTTANPAAGQGQQQSQTPSAWRDIAGRPVFAPGQALYNLIGKAANPLLVKLQLKAASPELRRQLRQMKLDVQKAQDVALEVAKESNRLTEGERLMVSDIIEKEMAAGTVPPEHAVRLATVMNDAMHRQSDELVRLGMLSKEAAAEWDGRYLPRFYESKLRKQVGDAWADAAKSLGFRPKSLKGIKGQHLKGRGLYETIPESQLASYEAMGWKVRDPDYTPSLPSVDGTVQVWRDFTRQERDAMGEIRDAGFRFVMGYMQTQRDIALGRMFEAMAADPNTSSRLPKDGWVRVPDSTVEGTGAKRYGKLAGRYVPAETLSQLTNIEEAQSAAWRMYRSAMAVWKQSKTALNPVSHTNNVVSNLTMAHFAGIGYHRWDKYAGALRDFVKSAPMVKEARDAGLFLGTMSDAELMTTMPAELKELAIKADSKVKKGAEAVFNAMTFWLRKPMGAAYQAEDTFFRYLIYRDARQRGVDPQDAVDYAQKYIFTYDDLPKGARMIRDFGIPFFAYTYKAVPALLNTALTRPDRFAAPAAVLWAANAAAYAIAAGDDDDSWMDRLKKYITDSEYRDKVRESEKLEREHLPQWMKGTTALFTPKAIRLGMDEVTKLPVFLDTSRIIPGGDLFDVSPNAGGLPIPQPITPSHPLFTLLYALPVLNKDPYFGKEIVDSNDTRAEATAKRAEFIWKQLTPAIAVSNYHWERGMNALAQANGGEVKWMPDVLGGDATGIGKDGLPVQPGYAAMQTFGIKARPIDLETAELIDANMKNKMIRDIDTELKKLGRLNAKGAVSDRVYDAEWEKAQTKKDRIREGLTVDGDERK